MLGSLDAKCRRARTAARRFARHFAKALEREDIFVVRVHRRVFQQFSEFVDDEQNAKAPVSGALDE